MSAKTNKYGIPVWEKALLNISEATEYFNIGRDKINQIIDEKEYLSLRIGKKKMIKREKMLKFLEQSYSI